MHVKKRVYFCPLAIKCMFDQMMHQLNVFKKLLNLHCVPPTIQPPLAITKHAQQIHVKSGVQ